MAIDIGSFGGPRLAKAVGIGVTAAIILAVLNVIALHSQVSPLPKPLGLAFAETVFGRTLPLPIGLLFHVAWVTFFSVLYTVLWPQALTLRNALLLAAALWLLVLLVFFPVVGWGFFGLAISPGLIVQATVSHLLFALILWSLVRLLLQPGAPRVTSPGASG
jgi:hypothetical protein